MKFKLFNPLYLFTLTLFVASCSSDDDGGDTSESIEKSAVIENYAKLVYQSYLDSYTGAVSLQTAVDVFIETPTDANFTAAKTAWLSARDIYGQTEAYRECNGPIDTENEAWSVGNEGQLNAWPIDESYIDYVASGTEAYAGSFTSIISDTSVTIDEATLASLNEETTDKSISTGWHAIEFLLWGQDNTLPSEDLPGQREYTDYTTADDADRRADYLQAATDLLVSDLNALTTTWAPNGTYRTVFEALDEDVALKQFINGAFFIAGDELSSERIIAPVDSTDGIDGLGQEDEHSCFSDNTHKDIWANAQGVYNVVFGAYGNVSGDSFYDLVKEKDAAQAEKLKDAADEAMAKVNAIANNSEPFDYLITLENSTDANFGVVMQSVVALQDWADEISASATVIGINL
ncbi:putative iron-regulated protein [Algibacter lectus]|uniref:imelysin family protein n=1 Tax=Algibacter lectus TaxID=221126 RepID=UPI0008E86C4B|nr:imelysin family protein [Algibacter lectus]SFC39494.1 putative iron-regulated protein [Algibacter lectus]